METVVYIYIESCVMWFENMNAQMMCFLIKTIFFYLKYFPGDLYIKKGNEIGLICKCNLKFTQNWIILFYEILTL